jgi:hypothetical protein
LKAVLVAAAMGSCAALGLNGTPVHAAPGFFSVENRGGAWWLVDPAGEFFFSLGVNVIAPGQEQAADDKAKPQYAAWRHYGSTEAWADTAAKRLRQWEFNTVGGWSHRLMRRGDLPYAEVLHLGAQVGAPWNDMFAEDFAQQMDRLAKNRVAPARDDPAVVGWFTDNELAWYPESLLKYHAAQPPTSATRQRLMQLLQDHYGDDFAALRRDFAPSARVSSMAELNQGGSLKLVPGGDYHAVVEEFTKLLAERYYGVVGAAVRRHDPHHLILGDRYHGYCPDAVARAAAPHVDVISTNYDWPRGVDGYLPRFYLRRLHALTDRPVLVTEYYSAAVENRSGNPNTGGLFVVVADQAQRAEIVERRLEMFAQEPFVVGAHWFAYADEPPHGRAHDGEDYNFGLVDIHDEPYEEVTTVMQRMHAATPERHAAAEATAAATTTTVVAPALVDAIPLERIDQSLLKQAEVPSAESGDIADLSATWDTTAIYLTVAGNHCVMADCYASPPTLAGEGVAWTVTIHAADNDGSSVTLGLAMLGDKAEPLSGAPSFVHWQRGVRYGATLAVPAAAVSRDAWHAGDTVALDARLEDRHGERATWWTAELSLATAAAPRAADRGASEATAQRQ